jgi:hypothetical protein
MLPMLGGEIIEGQERIPVLGEAGDGLVVFHAVLFDEEIEGDFGIDAGLGRL